jgi:hypothetical protein
MTHAIGLCPSSMDAAVAFCDRVTDWTAENKMAVDHKEWGLLQIMHADRIPTCRLRLRLCRDV